MNDYLSFFILILILNILFAFFILKNIDRFSRLFSLIDLEKNKIHVKDTPKYGFFVFSLLIISTLSINLIYFNKIEFYILLVYLLSFLLIGFLDDLYELKVWKRLVLATTVVSLFYYFNYQEYYVSSSFLNIINFLLLIFFTLGFIHLVNITDGLNGLVSSLFLYSCIYYFLKGFDNYDMFYKFFIIINIFIFLIFIIPNFLGICFLGNTGAYLIAIVVSILYLELYKISVLEYSDILLIYLIPLVDGLRVTLNRIKNRRNPFKGDFSHLHHLVRNNKFHTLIFFLIVFYPSFINFFYSEFTIIIGVISILSFFLFLIYIKKN